MSHGQVYVLGPNELAEQCFSYHISIHRSHAQVLDQAIDACISALSSLAGVNHWPARGWDYNDTIGTLNDLRSDCTTADIEQWVADEIAEQE